MNAVAVTGGATSLPPEDEFEAFAGSHVVIAFDCDSSGRRGARKLRDAFLSHGSVNSVRVLDLTKGGLTFSDRSGEDISDWFNRYAKRADDLRALAEATPPWDGREGDDVLRKVRSLFLADNDEAEDHLAEIHDDEGVQA